MLNEKRLLLVEGQMIAISLSNCGTKTITMGQSHYSTGVQSGHLP